jgi:hypothetical protein
MKHTPIFPEYLATSDAGFAYLINVEGFSGDEIKAAHHMPPRSWQRCVLSWASVLMSENAT